MNKTLEELEKEYKIASEKHSQRFHDAPLGMGWSEFDEYMSVTGKVVVNLSREIKLLKEPQFEEIPNYGDVFSMEDFVTNCLSGGFIDYDGSGNYARDGKMSNISVSPSDITSGRYRKDFDSVVWFNK